MIFRSLAAAALCLNAFTGGVGAQWPADHPRITSALELLDVWLDAQRAYDEIPGISAGVVYEHQLLWSKGFGYADLERRARASPATIYSICSISKLFTSIAVLQLRDAGRLRLDDPVSRHLSWFRIKRTHPEAAEITIEGLLTHSAGLPREADLPYWTGPDFPFPTREQIVERLVSQETLYPAETYYQYSNLGIALAGDVVAAASGKPYPAYIQENILTPLGLTSTTPEMPEQHRGGRLASGYTAITRDGSRKLTPFFQTRGIAPAAGFASTAEDLARFASWQFRLLGNGGKEVIKATTLREMQRVHWVDRDFDSSSTRGQGFQVWRSGGETFVGHGGSCPGYRTHLLLQPDERVATIFMTNAQGVNAQQFAQRMYDIVGPAIVEARKDSAPVGRPDHALGAYVGTYEAMFGTEIAVVRWEGGLATLSLPTTEPARNLTKLRKVGEHTFRRIRSDDTLGETVVFDVGPDGRATRFVWHSNHYRRIR